MRYFCSNAVLAVLFLVFLLPGSVTVRAEERNDLTATAEESSSSDSSSSKPSGSFLYTAGVPEGFELFNEPQVTVADFYYGGRYLESLTIAYTPSTVIINDPARLVGHIPYVANPEKIIDSLRGELPANPHLVCHSVTSSDCGQLEPEIAGIIYNAGLFRVDVFVTEEYLLTRTLDRSRYLPLSESGFGMVQGLSATASGSTGDEFSRSQYSLFGNTILGQRETHLVSDWDVSQQTSFQIDNAYLARELEGMQYGLGYLGTGSLLSPQLMNSSRVLGARIGTSFSTRIDTANISSSPIQVFLPSRGRVEVFRDNRLIHAESLEAGSQQVNTNSFPGGAYEVDIRIYSGSSLVQEFSQFYVKSYQLPPSDEIIWFLEGGDVVGRTDDDILPQSISTAQFSGGINFRLAEKMAMSLRGTYTQEQSALETELYYLTNGLELTATGLYGSQSTKGVYLQANNQIGLINNRLTYRRLWNDNYETAAESAYDLFGESYENLSWSLSAPLWSGSLSLSHSYNQNANGNKSRVNAIAWSRQVWRYNDYSLALQLNYSQSRTDQQALAGLTLSRGSYDWDYSISGESLWDRPDDGNTQHNPGVSVDGRWRDTDFAGGNLDTGAYYRYQGNNQDISGDVRYDNSLLASSLNVDHSIPSSSSSSSSTTNYTGRVESTFAVNTDGVGVGARSSIDSAVLVRIKGSPKTTFDVMVNGSPLRVARGGRSTIISLPPFATYDIAIQPRGEGFHDFDQNVRRVTLYPGNVPTLDFNTQEIVVLLGQIVNEDGSVIEGGTVEYKENRVYMSSQGIFQLRVPESIEKFTVFDPDGALCDIEVPPDYPVRGGIGMIGKVTCVN